MFISIDIYEIARAKLTEAIKDSGLRVDYLADKTGIQKDHIYDLMRGKVRANLNDICKIGIVMNKTPNYFLGFSDL